jgi:hypothetical protein
MSISIQRNKINGQIYCFLVPRIEVAKFKELARRNEIDYFYMAEHMSSLGNMYSATLTGEQAALLAISLRIKINSFGDYS